MPESNFRRFLVLVWFFVYDYSTQKLSTVNARPLKMDDIYRIQESQSNRPLAIVGTWDFSKIAIDAAIDDLTHGASSLDCVEKGIRAVEINNDGQYFVGVGGLPNADGDMEFDAAIMDHKLRYGAVMALRKIQTPISVARTILERSVHNVLVGEGALKWALSHGFQVFPGVLTEESRREWKDWKANMNSTLKNDDSHDTIGLICLDASGSLAAGTSTSGCVNMQFDSGSFREYAALHRWKFKHPGRVGDSPLIGSGLYCDGKVAAAVATGDGEEIMRVCLSFLVVECIRLGMSPRDACAHGIKRLQQIVKEDYDASDSTERMHAKLTVAVVAMDVHGNIGAASTIEIGNSHRGNAFFPAVYWKGDVSSSKVCSILRASSDGAMA